MRVAHQVEVGGASLPIHVLALGNPDPPCRRSAISPVLHGLERIGTRVLLVFLRGLLNRLKWDPLLHRQLESLRMVFVPLVNPGGIVAQPALQSEWRRSHAQRAAGRAGTRALPARRPAFQRPPALVSRPGRPAHAGGKPESQGVVAEELLPRGSAWRWIAIPASACATASGFPTPIPPRLFPHLPEVHALKDLFDQTYPTHNYVVEPQSRQYLAHGDLWDHFYLEARAQAGGAERVFLPLTLEMGSGCG